jgi:hypothetical protein
MTSPTPSTYRRSQRRLHLAVGALVGLPLIALAVTSIVIGRNTSPRPVDSTATPAKAAEGAAWAGFPDTSGLEVLKLYHEPQRDEMWEVMWKGSPEAVDRFVNASGFTAAFTGCLGPSLQTLSVPDLTRCQRGDDRWRRPTGQVVTRHVTRGALPDGTYIVHLAAVDF